LADKVVELQGNMYKGLHESEGRLNELTDQLKEWSESLTREFSDLCEYIEGKMEVMSAEVFKINLKLIDNTLLSRQGMKEEANAWESSAINGHQLNKLLEIENENMK
jgi:hypothetical protein